MEVIVGHICMIILSCLAGMMIGAYIQSKIDIKNFQKMLDERTKAENELIESYEERMTFCNELVEGLPELINQAIEEERRKENA